MKEFIVFSVYPVKLLTVAALGELVHQYSLSVQDQILIANLTGKQEHIVGNHRFMPHNI